MEEKTSTAPTELAKPLSSLVPSDAMAIDQSNPGDFISLSSEDEPPLAKKRKSPENDTSSVTGLDAPAERSKRARVSSASAGNSPGAKVSEEGEIDDDEDSEGEIRTPGSGDGKKSAGFASSGAFVPKSPPVYTRDSISLQLPVFSQQRDGTWLARFEEWAQLLCTANSTSAAKLTPMVIQDAYKQYIDSHSRLKANKKRAARQAAEQYSDESLAALIRSLQPRQKDAAKLPAVAAVPEALAEPKTQSNASSELPEAQVRDKSENSDPAVSLPPSTLTTQTDGYFVIDVKPQPPQTANSREPRPMSQPAPQSAAKTAMSQRPGLPSGEDALEQQRRYFPSASDPSNMCLLCGREGHTADGCTNCACKFCGQDDHWQYVCPSLELKCDKCDIRGHSAAGCATVREERGYVFKCSLCHSTAHTDERCTQPWRSFHPEAETIKTVTALPVSCASCGSSQHFSANCISDRVAMDPTFPTNPTFSMYNMSRYIDAASTSSAIIGADELAPKQQPGDLRIRGRASRSNEVRYYSDSDDSDDVQFLSQRAVPKPVRIGRISVSTNLQPPNGDQQPPLPPGPPPPDPPPPPSNRAPRRGYSQAPAGPNSLPARPPVPSRDYRSVPPPPSQPAQDSRQQSGRGGRGGGRGGSRGGRGGGPGGGRGYRGGKFRGGKGRGG
ncbi:hypothetical protein THAR02_08313 [Trichoderma harzianum]|uniref:CCHC-type domain-containing protein n=1 Tax=Trichoderma harzianum TaxID=5544 RepID=A0A0F9X4Q2_TRIHA|nr:hypothetical protein THAR02_08313 [Trichoderma harzianum]